MKALTISVTAALILLFSQRWVLAENEAPQKKNPTVTEMAKSSDAILSFWLEPLKETKSFYVTAHIHGSAEGVLTESAVLDYLRLRLKKTVSTVPIPTAQELRTKYSGPDEFMQDNTVGFVRLTVWAVGDDDYPIAMHVKFTCGPPASMTGTMCYEDATLGCTSKQNLVEDSKRAIDTLVEAFAVQFYKVRREM